MLIFNFTLLSAAQLLKFILFIAISKIIAPEHASQIFVGMSLAQLFVVITQGKIPAAKTELLQRNICSLEFNYIFKRNILRLSYALLSIISLFYTVDLLFDKDIYYFLIGSLLGLLITFNNLMQLASEVHGKANRYNLQICLYQLLLIIELLLYENILICTLFIITFEVTSVHFIDTKFKEIVSESSKGFKRIEIFTNIASALEMPAVYLISSSEGTVTYALLMRLYSSVITFSGQISRPLWKYGEWHTFIIKAKEFCINVNLYFGVIFTTIILVAYMADNLLGLNNQSEIWSIAFLVYALCQIWNRFFKNKFLNMGTYGHVALGVQYIYMAYIILLIFVLFFTPYIGALLLLKVILATSILIYNYWKFKNA